MKFLSRVPLNKLILACGRAQRPSRKRGPVCRNGTLFLWGKQWRFYWIQSKILCTNFEPTNFRFCYEKTGLWLWWSMLVVLFLFLRVYTFHSQESQSPNHQVNIKNQQRWVVGTGCLQRNEICWKAFKGGGWLMGGGEEKGGVLWALTFKEPVLVKYTPVN